MQSDEFRTYPLAGVPYLFPGMYTTEEDRQNYLNTLDSDTRNYVIEHVGFAPSQEDAQKCLNKRDKTYYS